MSFFSLLTTIFVTKIDEKTILKWKDYFENRAKYSESK